ncbi:Adenylate kinase [[Mycoplasma] cavipharyngis]|uniref:adenylate kinase family protein n=1 Tax=[Mycoplasma] cavipharyngis TaxID=92757 RepID=UPI003703DBF6
MKFILLLGAPGAGKGSISEYLVKHHNFIHVSTGDIFRQLANKNNKLANQIKKILAAGQLVPDSLTNQLILDHLKQLEKINYDQYVVLDGYPRTLSQASFFQQHFSLDRVIVLKCSQDQIIFRLTNRLVCEKGLHTYHIVNKPPKSPYVCDIDQSMLIQRKDDQIDVILHRLRVYQTQTASLIEFYKQLNLVIFVNADQSIEQTINEVNSVLNLKK